MSNVLGFNSFDPRENTTDGTKVPARKRFLLELEFVQCLASPDYLLWLAQSGLLEDQSFVAFLKYLQYWKLPEYSKYIIYPHCLYFLDLLQQQEFRKAVANPNYKELVHEQQFYYWLHSKTPAGEKPET